MLEHHDQIPAAQDVVGSADVTWRELLTTLTARRDLTAAEARWATSQVVAGRATTVETAGFLTALRTKGETAAELVGLVTALLESAIHVAIPGRTVDIAGTGGDGTGAANISTLAAIVAAGAGARVVKHGGRSASSRTGGSADLIEQLGVPLDLTPEEARAIAIEVGLVFLFGPRFNPGLRHAIDARRGLGIPTALNLVAPLINPARPRHQVVGVADGLRAPMLAEAMVARGRVGLVVHGRDGLDKLTTVTGSDVWIVGDHGVRHTRVDPRRLGLSAAGAAALRGGTPATNAANARALLTGERGPLREVVLLNAAAVLVALERPSPDTLDDHLRSALDTCTTALDSGAAAAVLERMINTAALVRASSFSFGTGKSGLSGLT